MRCVSKRDLGPRKTQRKKDVFCRFQIQVRPSLNSVVCRFKCFFFFRVLQTTFPGTKRCDRSQVVPRLSSANNATSLHRIRLVTFHVVDLLLAIFLFLSKSTNILVSVFSKGLFKLTFGSKTSTILDGALCSFARWFAD